MRRTLAGLLLILTTTACSPAASPGPAEPTTPPAAAPAPGWRTETWAGLSVDVPDDWGYGSAPSRFGGELAACPEMSTSGPDAPGWVGRPIMVSDACGSYPWPKTFPPTSPFVWLAPDIPLGVVRYDGGLVQVTVERFGVRLTVAATEAALRKRILDSARPADHCQGDTSTVPEVCGYRRGDDDELMLVYAAGLSPEAARAVLDAVADAPVAGPCRGRFCSIDGNDQVRVSDGERTAVYDFGWRRRTVTVDDGPPRRATGATTRPWLAPGLRWTLATLIGMQG